MPQQDTVQRFLCNAQDWRGEIVRLEQSYQTIMNQHGYPKAVRLLLGEALLAAVLMMSTMKFEGQLTLQFQSDEGPLEMLVAKCNHELHIRGLAQWQSDATAEELAQGLQDGQLVLTLEYSDRAEPYQSVVAIEQGSITQALERYFVLSEQLPTLFQLAVTDTQAVGMMLQLLPSQQIENQQQSWAQVGQALRHFSQHELLNSENVALIACLQEQEDTQLFAERAVSFHCPCSIERMERALLIMEHDEVLEILDEKQEVVVTCEYCNHSYSFGREDIARIFE